MDVAELQRSLASGDEAERARLLRETIRTHVAALLSLTSVEDDGNFLDLGLNSLSALELTKNLMTITELEIPLVTIVDHPTPAELAGHLAAEYTRASTGASAGEGVPK
ncbi:acyl carrier protein [Actinomadura oligospora]|uniref:acyl carrier protein n=1 Tax=Actinomadura oligospora TaxID=111804 RepID=UPI0004B3D244|nr:acyl carrier protein [Actinomadura oligospora]